jgi:hypothetical protein
MAMRPAKWLWILTLLNIAIASLLILGIRAMLFALRAFAAYVSGWPVLVLTPLGIALSVIGILVGKRTNSQVPRRLGFVINGSALALHSIIILGIIAIFMGVRRQRFLIPEGYRGDIYVIHNVEDGEPEKRNFGQVTYRIPRDGILRTQAPIIRGLTTTAYYYVRDDGTLERIRYTWLTTIHRTPENLADDKHPGVFFPRSGKYGTSSNKCVVEFELFYVGTKAYLLSGYQQKDLGRYLKEHPVTCADRAN